MEMNLEFGISLLQIIKRTMKDGKFLVPGLITPTGLLTAGISLFLPSLLMTNSTQLMINSGFLLLEIMLALAKLHTLLQQ